MNTISEVLAHYNLTLEECEDTWREMVEEFERVKTAMPDHIVVQREKEIADAFLDYHDVTDDAPPPDPKPAQKKTSGKKHGKASGFQYDEQAIFDKADKMLEDMP